MKEEKKIAYLRTLPIRKDRVQSKKVTSSPKNDSDKILVFDTETTSDEYLSLTFGSFQVRERERIIEIGAFYNPSNLDAKKLDVLKSHCKVKGIPLYTLTEFVNIFYKVVYQLGATCVGFNLPFDLSRIAMRWNGGRRKVYDNKIMNRDDKFFLTLTEDRAFPGIRIQHISSTCSFISFASSWIKQEEKTEGSFLDLKTLASILLHDKGISLNKACEQYGLPRKHTIQKHGEITPQYIDYNLNDVEMTYQLYKKLKEEYEKFGLNASMSKVYSEASLGKQLLRQLSVKNFESKNPQFPKELLGKCMSAYYGGLTGCKHRKNPIKVSVLDFKSQYPSTFSLMGLWSFVIADKIEYEDYTESARELIKKTSLETLTQKSSWKDMMILCEVEPNEDILPLRSNYHPTLKTTNIGLNFITSKRPLWYAMGDVLASKLLTGKIPKIKKAIRFYPVGVQKGLVPVNVLGIKIDPTRDVIQQLIEKRFDYIKKAKTEEKYKPLQIALKILASATSYGIFIEMNPMNESSDVTAYSDVVFSSHMDQVEEEGKFYNPVIPVHQIACSRLLMAMAEAWLKKYGKQLMYLDTDSLFVTPDCAKDLHNFFQPLFPYNVPGKMLEIKMEDMWFYGISSKRYVLYRFKGNKIEIGQDDYRLHGLGHLLNPFNNIEKWHIEVWRDILDLHYGKVSELDLIEKYQGSFAIGKMSVTTPQIFKRFREMNKKNPSNKQIRPFNFFLYGQGAELKRKKVVRPLAKYSSKNTQEAAFKEFIDYTTGKVMIGEQYWQTLDKVFFDYLNHPETKFENGDKSGWMKRRHVLIDGVKYIGKEVRNVEPSVVDELPRVLEMK